MDRIAKGALSVIVFLCAVFVLFFGLCWYFDGFFAAWGVFFGSDSLSAILSFIGAYDWFIGIVLAIGIAAIVEILIGRKIKAKTARFIVDISAGIVSLVSFFILLSNTSK